MGKEHQDCKKSTLGQSQRLTLSQVNGQRSTKVEVIKLTDWMMTSASDVSKQAIRADVDADVAMMTLAMTSVGDLVARGVCERMVQSSSKILLAREGAWSV